MICQFVYPSYDNIFYLEINDSKIINIKNIIKYVQKT